MALQAIDKKNEMVSHGNGIIFQMVSHAHGNFLDDLALILQQKLKDCLTHTRQFVLDGLPLKIEGWSRTQTAGSN